MKKTILTFLIIFVFSINTLIAQEKQSREKIDALKIAFITEKISLTEKQAQEFWPLYNAFEEEKNLLRKKGRDYSKSAKVKFENLSNDQIIALIKQKFIVDEKLLNLEKTYFEKYQSVISIKQIALLYQSEKEFRREVLKRIKQRK